MEKINTDCEWRTLKKWPFFSRCAIRDVAPKEEKINADISWGLTVFILIAVKWDKISIASVQ